MTLVKVKGPHTPLARKSRMTFAVTNCRVISQKRAPSVWTIFILDGTRRTQRHDRNNGRRGGSRFIALSPKAPPGDAFPINPRGNFAEHPMDVDDCFLSSWRVPKRAPGSTWHFSPRASPPNIAAPPPRFAAELMRRKEKTVCAVINLIEK